MDFENIKKRDLFFLEEKIKNVSKKLKLIYENFKAYFPMIFKDKYYDNVLLLELIDRRLKIMEDNWHNVRYKEKCFTLGRIKVLRRLIKEYIELENSMFANKKVRKEILREKRKKLFTYFMNSFPNFWD